MQQHALGDPQPDPENNQIHFASKRQFSPLIFGPSLFASVRLRQIDFYALNLCISQAYFPTSTLHIQNCPPQHTFVAQCHRQQWQSKVIDWANRLAELQDPCSLDSSNQLTVKCYKISGGCLNVLGTLQMFGGENYFIIISSPIQLGEFN